MLVTHISSVELISNTFYMVLPFSLEMVEFLRNLLIFHMHPLLCLASTTRCTANSESVLAWTMESCWGHRWESMVMMAGCLGSFDLGMGTGFWHDTVKGVVYVRCKPARSVVGIYHSKNWIYFYLFGDLSQMMWNSFSGDGCGSDLCHPKWDSWMSWNDGWFYEQLMATCRGVEGILGISLILEGFCERCIHSRLLESLSGSWQCHLFPSEFSEMFYTYCNQIHSIEESANAHGTEIEKEEVSLFRITVGR